MTHVIYLRVRSIDFSVLTFLKVTTIDGITTVCEECTQAEMSRNSFDLATLLGEIEGQIPQGKWPEFSSVSVGLGRDPQASDGLSLS